MGRPEAWVELRDFVAARGLALSRTAFLLTGSEAAAEDLLQDTYLDVVRKWWRIDHSNPEPYVRRIMYSRFVDGYRRRRLRDWAFTTGDADSLPSVPSPGHEAGVVDRLTFVDALRLLTPRQRTVLVLRFYDDLSEAQTAEAMKVSRNTVKSQTRLALRRLGELVPDLAPSVSEFAEEVGRL
jgi:RNA polymerase sigma-70 factor (sigma-E family)